MTSVYEDPSTWRGRTTSGIPYRLVSMRGEVEYAKASAVEEILIRSTDLLAFIFESFPPPRFFNGFPTYLPRQMPGMSRLVTRKIAWEPFMDGLPIDPFGVDPSADSGTYHDVIKLNITYDNERREENQDRNRPESFLEISSDTACTVLNVSARAAKWKRHATASDGTDGEVQTAESFPDESATPEPNTDPAQMIPKIIPQTEWSLTWSRIDRDWFVQHLKPILDSCMGKVNEEIVSFLNAPKECLLFCGYAVRDQRYAFGPDDAPAYDWTGVSVDTVAVTMKLLSKDVFDDEAFEWRGHNHFWRDETGQWERVVIGSSSRPVYELTDLNDIFEAPLTTGLNA